MKKLLIVGLAIASLSAFAAEKKAEAPKKAEAKKVETKKVETVKEEKSRFWGFGSFGIYSGYQLYGALLNNEPTFQWYLEGNYNLGWDDVDLGFIGLGVWSNSDLTPRRDSSLGNMFNEWDFNIHWQKTFWFDNDKTVGLTYRSYVVWYYYPGENYRCAHPATATTFDWDHYFELTNPWVIPYVNWVHEYLQSNGNVFQFGIKKPFQITDDFSLCPILEFIARDGNYNWCFPTRFGNLTGEAMNPERGWTSGGMATLKVELDANYQISKHWGLFAKVAYCSIIDHHMRNSCDDTLASDEYGENKDFVWGGVGVSCNF